MATRDKYNMDMLKVLKRIAVSLERIERNLREKNWSGEEDEVVEVPKLFGGCDD